VGRGGRPTSLICCGRPPNIARKANNICIAMGCRYLPRSSGDRSGPVPLNANCPFHGPLNGEAASWLIQGWVHGRISNETYRIRGARSFGLQRNYRVGAGSSCIGRWQTRGNIPGVEFGRQCSVLPLSLLPSGVLASLSPPLVVIIKIGGAGRASPLRKKESASGVGLAQFPSMPEGLRGYT
jgi:hypothetical protein